MVPDLAGLVKAAPWLTSVTLTAITYIKSRTARQGIQAARAILEGPHRRGGLHIGFQQFKGSAFAVTVTEPGANPNTAPPNTAPPDIAMPIAWVPGGQAATCAESAGPGPESSLEPGVEPGVKSRAEFGEEFAAFYGHAYPWAISRLRGLTGLDTGTAHDAVQEAFIACRRHWATLEPLALRSRRAYLLTAATRMVRDRHGRDSVVRPWDPADGLADLGHPLAGPEHEVILRQEVFRALKNLPERQREIVLRRHYADLTVEEIATQMGIAQRTVRTHLRRHCARCKEEHSMIRRESAQRDEALTAVITAALDSVYATPVDPNASLVDLQDRLAAGPDAENAENAENAIPVWPARRRISRPGLRVGGILIAAAAVFFLCVFFSAALAGTIIGARTNAIPGRPDRSDPAAAAQPGDGNGSRGSAISLSSLHPDTTRATSGPLVRSTLGNGQPVIKWVPRTSSGADTAAAETFSYSSPGPATFSAELPSLASGLTASCKWTVQIQGQPAQTYYTQDSAPRPIDLSVTHPGAITITVALTRPATSAVGCTMIQMPLPGPVSAPAEPAGPAGPADSASAWPAATPYGPLLGTQPEIADASPAPTMPPPASPGATASPSQSASPKPSPSPRPSPTGKT